MSKKLKKKLKTVFIKNYQDYKQHRNELVAKYPKIIKIENRHDFLYLIILLLSTIAPGIIIHIGDLMQYDEIGQNIPTGIKGLVLFPTLICIVTAINLYLASFEDLVKKINKFLEKQNHQP